MVPLFVGLMVAGEGKLVEVVLFVGPMVVVEGRKVGVAHYGVLMVVVEVKKVVAVESLVEQVVNQVLLFLLSFLHISFPIVLGLLFLITKGWVVAQLSFTCSISS